MSALRFVPAAQLERAALVAVFNDAYRGYEVPLHVDEPTFDFMAKLVDMDLGRSVVAYEGATAAAMAMLARRGVTSWIGGMGVVPEFRGRGYGADVMRHVIDNARGAGARSVDLEVLESNAPAIRIYEALGFRHTRRLVVWLVAPPATPPAVVAPAESGILPLDVQSALDIVDEWTSDSAPWQRARGTLANLVDPPAALGLMRDGAVAGAVVYRAVGERVSLLALAALPFERETTLAALLDAVIARHPAAALRFLNLPADDPATPMIERLGGRPEARQFEMRLPL